MNGGHEHAGGYAPGSRSWKHLPRILPYLRRFWPLAAVAGGMLFVGVAISLAEPWPLAFLVDAVLGQHRPPNLVAHLFGSGKQELVLVAAGAGLVLALLGNSLNVVTEYVNTKLDSRLRLAFRRDLFAKAQQLSLTYHDTHRAGYFAQNINTHTTALGRIVVDIPPLVQSVLTLIGMFFIAFKLDPTVALLSLTVVPFIYYSTVYYGKHIEPRLIHTRDQEGLSLSIVHEAMQMLRVILAFRREDHELARFSGQANHAIGLRLKVTVKQTLFSLAVNVITAAGTALVLGFGAEHVLSHRLTVGELLVMLGYIAAVYKPLETISSTMGAWQEHLVDFWLALELLDQKPEIIERPGAVDLGRASGRVTFEKAGFAYPSREATLVDISFDAPAGSVVAVVGPTGAGKTTLTNLIPRFYEVGQGRVLLDGHDVRDLTMDAVRNNVAMVMQEPLLFLATIAENIRYGRLDATMDEVMEAARQANAHDFITALPQGYDTKLGERGSMLSGGERQRICVARAFLKDAPILLLDEPTSSIDSRTEGGILDALTRLMVGRTTFIVAHRLSTIGAATLILVLDKGRLVEQGTHGDLVAIEGGLYRQLWEAQTGGARRPVVALPAAAPADAAPADAAPADARPTAPAPLEAPAFPAPPAVAGRPKAVVLGMMAKMPVAGVVWQTIHYLIGLERLGYDAYYVEAHARTPTMLMREAGDDSSALAAGFIKRVMSRFGLDGRWAFHALHDDGRVLGMSEEELRRLYAGAAVIFNLHGGTQPLPEHAATGRLVYLETDPCEVQVNLHNGDQATLDFLEPHAAFFTFGENLGKPGCLLPVHDRFRFLPTRQPVLVDLWEARGLPAGPAFTTVANWRQPWRELTLDGETFHWSKHHEFLKVLDLPTATGAAFELALSGFEPADQQLLEAYGWTVRSALDVSRNADVYRSFVAGSRAEFTVAKDQNLRLQSGWFSDRSATYLAAGRPVITQDTGFGVALPTGSGLLAFSGFDQAADAVAAVTGHYARHSRAALEVARGYFDAPVVLGELLGHLGLPVSLRRPSKAAPLPADLSLTPESRRPLVLPEPTRARVLARQVGAPAGAPASGSVAGVVVVTHENLACTRLCLESVLAAGGPAVEVVVVDNASTDGTPAYLSRLAAQDARVRLIANEANAGFAAGVNQGVAATSAPHVVILNNDTVVAPGWLEGLLAHLSDPKVGAVGPVTGRIGNEAEVEAAYDTHQEFLAFAAARAGEHRGVANDIPMLAMFCVAMRRAVLEEIGPLDEGFGLGLFEDDDYAERLRRHGYRLVCAEDVFVHHFGEASFGELVPTGDYARLFEANKARFEAKWQTVWTGHGRRRDPRYNAAVARTTSLARRVLPPDAQVLVVSHGDEALLAIGPGAQHFPQGVAGAWAGHHPASSEDAIQQLTALQQAGASHFLLPRTARWWLDHYAGLAAHLRQEAAVMVDNEDFLLLSLGAAPTGPARTRPTGDLSRSAR